LEDVFNERANKGWKFVRQIDIGGVDGDYEMWFLFEREKETSGTDGVI